MKHKRQTLSKQGEDGDDKDSTTSEGGKSGSGGKLGDKYLDDEMSKKSCQGCELPGVGACGAGLSVSSGQLDDPPELGQPTRGNNNNTPSATNNNNSNGASSVASSTSSFDKMLGEDDSRSNEEITPKTTVKKISVKVEGVRKSSPSNERRIGLCKTSPGTLKENGTNPNLLLAIGDGLTPTNSVKGTRSLTPSSAPSTPLQYAQQLPRSSPTTATAIASATVTIQNVPSTFNRTNHFPQAAQYPVADYPRKQQQVNQQHYQMNHQQHYGTEMTYDQQQMVNHHSMMMGRRNHRGNQNYHQQNQYQQYYGSYSGKTQQDGAYHGVNQNYNHGYSNTYNNHYGYNHQMYGAGTNAEPENAMTSAHTQHESTGYYPTTDNSHHIQHKSDSGYYDGSVYENYANQSTDAASFPSAASAVMTPPASVQPDPSTTEGYGGTQFHQFYGNSGSSEPPQTHVPQTGVQSTAGENSNSSADFNFLSNLANDFAPEYYQLS